MITRVSLVKLRPGVDRASARAAWLGPHADVVREASGVTRYEIAFAEGDRSAEQWDALAIVAFEGEEALRSWLGDEDLQARLLATREPFVERVEAFLVEAHRVLPEDDERGGA